MALGPDPYAVLGVPRDASDDQIERARRRLSREYHPDVNPAPDAAARFDEVQQAYRRLSAGHGVPVPSPGRARDRDQPGRDQRDQDQRGRTRVMRDPGGGYGSATEASPGIFIQPAAVDFGRLTPGRPRADAKVTVAWTGAPPARLESSHGSEWWASLGSEQPAKSCVVFYLRAHAHGGTPNGRERAEFTVVFDDTTLTVQLTAEIAGEFPPGSRPDFTPRQPPGADGRGPVLPAEVQAWLLVMLALLILLVAVVVSS
jgi:DnaJ domain